MHLIENPKLANIGFELLTFDDLLGHKGALMQNPYPSFHFHMKPKQRFYLFWIEQKEKKTSLKLTLALIYGRIFHAHTMNTHYWSPLTQ